MPEAVRGEAVWFDRASREGFARSVRVRPSAEAPHRPSMSIASFQAASLSPHDPVATKSPGSIFRTSRQASTRPAPSAAESRLSERKYQTVRARALSDDKKLRRKMRCQPSCREVLSRFLSREP